VPSVDSHGKIVKIEEKRKFSLCKKVAGTKEVVVGVCFVEKRVDDVVESGASSTDGEETQESLVPAVDAVGGGLATARDAQVHVQQVLQNELDEFYRETEKAPAILKSLVSIG